MLGTRWYVLAPVENLIYTRFVQASVLVSIESIFTAFSLISTLIRVMIMPLLADTAGV